MKRLVAVVLLAHGCTLVDERPEIEIYPPGDLVAGYTLAFDVRAKGAETARIYLDDEELMQVRVNTRARIQTVGWTTERNRRLRVRLDGLPYPVEEERTVLTRGPHPGLAVVAPSGPVRDDQPFDVVITSTEELDVAPDTGADALGSGAPVPTEVVVAPDERTVTVRVLRPLAETGPIRLRGDVRTRWTGYAVFLHTLTYAPSAAPITFLSPAAWAARTAPVPVSLEVDHPLGGALTVRADCGGTVRTVGEIQDVGVHGFEWDPADAPDGPCLLSASATGWRPAVGPTFHLDRVPPAISRCVSDGRVAAPVRIELDPEAPVPTDTTRAALVAHAPGATFVPSEVSRGPGYLSVRRLGRIDTPADVTFVLAGGLVDAAGNRGAETSCTVAYPGWWRALDGAIADLAPSGIAPGSVTIFEGASATRLTWLDEQGAAWSGSAVAGRPVQVARLSAPGVSVAEVVAGPSSDAWIERTDGGGPTAIRLGAARLALPAGTDASELSITDRFVAWTEGAPGGPSRVAWASHALGSTAHVPAATGASAHSPSIWAAEWSGTRLAWIEDAEGVPARVRTWWVGSDSPSGPPALDATAPARTPSVLSTWVAWDEGGRIVVNEVWGGTSALSTAGVVARRPVLSMGADQELRVSWIEGDAAGERLVTRRWSGTAWVEEPPVDGLDARAGELVSSRGGTAAAWIDPGAVLHAALRNR